MPPKICMEPKDVVLRIIYNLVKDDADPTTFPCSYRDIILKNSLGINVLQEYLDQLIIEELVIAKKLDRQVFCITEKGLERVHQMERNSVVDSNKVY